MSKKICELVLKIGVLLSFVSFFIVSNSLYFPYITGKQLYFNLLVEALLLVWFYLVAKFPETRPKFSLVTWSLTAWLMVLLISSIFGVDFNLSFWGDTERMLGWFSLFHFFAFYLIIITVFRSKNDWLGLLSSSVFAAVGLAVYAWVSPDKAGIGNVNMLSNISTLGNATYVAGVMLFNIYFIIYLWLNLKSYGSRLWHLISLLAVLLAFFYANVSGSTAGLIVSLFGFAVIIGLLDKNKKIKLYSGLAAGLVIVLVALAFIFRQQPIFDNNKVGFMLREFSTQSTSLGARTFAWRAGWQGFLERPILGFGWGNFAEPFDKYFKAGLYKLTPNEEFYDRAHNMPIEMLATAGIFGLLTYLGMFVAVAISLIKAWRVGTIKTIVLATVSGMFIAYFVHNLAVFDSLANFVCLMVALALVTWLSTTTDTDEATPSANRPAAWVVNLNLAIVAVALGFVAYYGSIRPGLMLSSAVKTAQSWYYAQSIDTVLKNYQQTISYKTPLDRDIVVMFNNLIIGNPQQTVSIPADKLGLFLTAIVAQSQANLNYNQHDYFLLTNHARLLQVVGLISQDKKTIEKALAITDQAIANGGEHLPARILKANILVILKDPGRAIEVLRQALNIWPKYTGAFCRLAQLELTYGSAASEADVWKNMDDCLDSGIVDSLEAGDYLVKVLNHYQQLQDEVRLKKIQSIISSKQKP